VFGPNTKTLSDYCRYSSVDVNTGKYLRPSNPTLIYGTLTWIRANIVLTAGKTLARGVTIAVRYCAIRRQFQDRDAPEGEKGETQVSLTTLIPTFYSLQLLILIPRW
jgi:acyl-CoA oxidase